MEGRVWNRGQGWRSEGDGKEWWKREQDKREGVRKIGPDEKEIRGKGACERQRWRRARERERSSRTGRRDPRPWNRAPFILDYIRCMAAFLPSNIRPSLLRVKESA